MANRATIEAFRDELAQAQQAERYRSPLAIPAFRTPLFATFDSLGFAEVLSGTELEERARWRYGDQAPKREATDSARGVLTLTNVGATPHTFSPGTLVAEHATSGKRYRNVGGGTLPGARYSSARTLALLFEAEEPGVASSAAPNAISVLVAPLDGVTVSNAAAFLGRSADSDTAYRTALLSPDAISQAVRRARRADTTLVGATRARRAGNVVSLAGASGALAGSDVDALRAVLPRDVRAGALSATSRPIAISYTLEVLDADAPSSAALEATIAARLAEHVATLPIGPASLRSDALDTAIRSALGLRVSSIGAPAGIELHVGGGASALVSLALTAPSSDVELAAHEVATLGTVTPTVVRS